MDYEVMNKGFIDGEKIFSHGKDVTHIRFEFENMESYTIPIECFKYIGLKLLENNTCELKCHIVDNGGIKSAWNDNEFSFAQRVNKYMDIDGVAFIWDDGDEFRYEVVWYWGENDDDWYSHEQTNLYQSTIFHSYKEIEFSIAKSNKVYDIVEVLSIGMSNSTLFRDEFEVCYKSNGGFLYVIDTNEPMTLSLDILNSKFTKAQD